MSFQKFKVMYGFGEVGKEMGLKGKIRGKIEYPLVIYIDWKVQGNQVTQT